jgi:long-chain fatty acid transport protein
LLSARAHALDLGLSLGARLSAAWFVGLGLRGLSGLEGNVRVANQNQPGGVEVDLSLNLAPVAGVLFRPTSRDSFGLAFRGALSAPFEVEVADQGLPGIALPPLHIDGIAHYDPAEFAAEWAHGFGSTRAALGVTYQRWSAFSGWLGRTVSCPPEQPECAALGKEEVELSDTLSPRLGISHVLDLGSADLTLRAGYAFEASPLPEQTGSANRWDNARSIVTLGWGVSLLDVPLGLNLVYQAHLLHERTHEKSDPTSEPSVSEVSVSGHVQFLAVNLEIRY